MEMTYADTAEGGAFSYNNIPELTQLSREGDDFSGDSGLLNGGKVLPGTTFTMGGLFAQTAALPLKVDIGEEFTDQRGSFNKMNTQDSFFKKVTNLGDILEDQGYKNVFMLGSNATFGGRRLYFSTQSGRQYILGYHYAFRKPMFFRLDSIRKIKPMDVDPNPEKYEEFWKDFDQHLWGVSTGEHTLDHIEMLVHVGPDEGFIANRLKREKRHGIVEQVDDETWKFTADVYDASEMMPWLRTFIGRIVKLECSNASIARLFRDDLEKMCRMYGGEP